MQFSAGFGKNINCDFSITYVTISVYTPPPRDKFSPSAHIGHRPGNRTGARASDETGQADRDEQVLQIFRQQYSKRFALHAPQRNQLSQFLGFIVCEIRGLRRIGCQIVQLEHLFRKRRVQC